MRYSTLSYLYRLSDKNTPIQVLSLGMKNRKRSKIKVSINVCLTRSRGRVSVPWGVVVHGSATIITSKGWEFHDLQDLALDKCAELLGTKSYNTRCEY